MILFFLYFLISITCLSLRAEDDSYASFRSSVITGGKPILRGGGPEPEEDENPVSSVIEDGELVLSGIGHAPEEKESSGIDETEIEQGIHPSNHHNGQAEDLTLLIKWLMKNYDYKIYLPTRRNGDASSPDEESAFRSHSKKRSKKNKHHNKTSKKRKHKSNKKKVESLESNSDESVKSDSANVERSDPVQLNPDNNPENLITLDISNEKLDNANWGIDTNNEKFNNQGSKEENGNANNENVNTNGENVRANDDSERSVSIDLKSIVDTLRNNILKLYPNTSSGLRTNDIGTSHSKKHKKHKKLQTHANIRIREVIPQRRFMAPEIAAMNAKTFKVREELRKEKRREKIIQKRFLHGQKQRLAMYEQNRRSNNLPGTPSKVKLRAVNGDEDDQSWLVNLKAYMEELVKRVSRRSIDKYTIPIIKAIEDKNNVNIIDIDVDRNGQVLVDYVDLRNNRTYIDPRKINYMANQRKNNTPLTMTA